MAINQENLDPKKLNKDDVTRKEGGKEGISQDREHMAEIGKKDDQFSQQQQQRQQQPTNPGQVREADAGSSGAGASKDTLKK